MKFFLKFLLWQDQNIFMGFATIENVYVMLYRCDVIEYINVGENVGLLYYIQLFSHNLGCICLYFFAFLSI